jgi:hypothetical protein
VTEKNSTLEKLLELKESLKAIQTFYIENPTREITQEEVDLFKTLDAKTKELTVLYNNEGDE